MNKYLIDTNIFIESAYRFYAFDICPGFWDFLEKCSESDFVKSIDKVYNEITSNKPELQDFKEKLKNEGFFLSTEKYYVRISQESFTNIARHEIHRDSDKEFFWRCRFFLGCTCLPRILYNRNTRSQKR